MALTPSQPLSFEEAHGVALERALPEIARLRIAVLICYDVEIPELARLAAAQGAEVLLVPSWTDDAQGFHRVRLCAQARCIENQVYVIHAPLVGRARGVPGFEQGMGRAAIFSPADLEFPPGGILAEGAWNQDACVVAQLDLALLRRNRTQGTVRPLEDGLRFAERGITVGLH